MVHDGIGCCSCALQYNYDPSVDTFGGIREGSFYSAATNHGNVQ